MLCREIASERMLSEMPKVWHGSPHTFDRFSLDHIGTGQGAQTYGWGLYFASVRDVAIAYRDKLTRSRLVAWPEWLHGIDSSVVLREAERLFHDPEDVSAVMLIWNALHISTGTTGSCDRAVLAVQARDVWYQRRHVASDGGDTVRR